MQILRVAQNVYPDVNGGSAYHVHAMSRDQAAMGHEVTVLTTGDGDARETGHGYRVVRCPERLSVWDNELAPAIWRYASREQSYDVVHAHSHLYFSTNLVALRRRFDGVPLAITNHGLYTQSAPAWLFGAYLRTIGRWTFDSADTVFCYSDVDERRLRELGVSTSVSVVPNGIDTTRFTPDGAAATVGVDPNAPLVLFVGRLVEGKRPNDALTAFARVREQRRDVRFAVAGTGPMAGALERQAERLGVSDAVSFLGHVDYARMPALYRRASLLVLPSRAEGQPRTVLEAMATGLPFVATDLDQLGPLLERGGLPFGPGDVETCASHVETLLEHPEQRDRLGDRGRRYVESEHRWRDTVRETTRVLEDVAENAGRRP